MSPVELSYVALQGLMALVFLVGAILAMAGRVRPGRRGVFGTGCGLVVVAIVVGTVVGAFGPELGLDADAPAFVATTIGCLLVQSAGSVLVVVYAVDRRPAYPYPPGPFPQQPAPPYLTFRDPAAGRRVAEDRDQVRAMLVRENMGHLIGAPYTHGPGPDGGYVIVFRG